MPLGALAPHGSICSFNSQPVPHEVLLAFSEEMIAQRVCEGGIKVDVSRLLLAMSPEPAQQLARSNLGSFIALLFQGQALQSLHRGLEKETGSGYIRFAPLHERLKFFDTAHSVDLKIIAVV